MAQAQRYAQANPLAATSLGHLPLDTLNLIGGLAVSNQHRTRVMGQIVNQVANAHTKHAEYTAAHPKESAKYQN